MHRRRAPMPPSARALRAAASGHAPYSHRRFNRGARCIHPQKRRLPVRVEHAYNKHRRLLGPSTCCLIRTFLGLGACTHITMISAHVAAGRACAGAAAPVCNDMRCLGCARIPATLRFGPLASAAVELGTCPATRPTAFCLVNLGATTRRKRKRASTYTPRTMLKIHHTLANAVAPLSIDAQEYCARPRDRCAAAQVQRSSGQRAQTQPPGHGVAEGHRSHHIIVHWSHTF